MSIGRLALPALGFVLIAAAPARADDAKARALVEKAIQAHGGAALAKFQGTTVKMKGTFHGMGAGIDFTGSVATQGPEHLRVDIVVEVQGQNFPIANVIDGDKGWNRLGETTRELDKDELAEAKEQAYAGWVATLAPLKDGAFTLALVGEARVGDRPAVGVKVSRKGRRDVDLYFDKETSMLAKVESRVKEEGTGNEVTEESFPSEYKDVQGTRQAMKFKVKRDGKPHVEGEVTECQLSEKLDPGTFARP